MELVSSLPGRVRYREPLLLRNGRLCRRIGVILDNIGGVKYSLVNQYTASILVLYDQGKLSLKTIEDGIREALEAAENRFAAPLHAPLGLTAAGTPSEAGIGMSGKSSGLSGESYGLSGESTWLPGEREKARNRFALLASVFGLMTAKRLAYGKYPLSGNRVALIAASLTAVIGGFPPLRELYKKYAGVLPVNPDALLNLAANVLTFARESAWGTFVLAMKALNDYSCAGAGFRKGGYPINGGSSFETGHPSGFLGVIKERASDFNIAPFRLENVPVLGRGVRQQERSALPAAVAAGALACLLSGNLMDALSVMLVTSPAASGTALISGIRNYFVLLGRHGIYLADPSLLERIFFVNHIVLDEFEEKREEPVMLVRRLKSLGLEKISIVTSKRPSKRCDFSKIPDISRVYYGCSEEDKASIVKSLKKGGSVMVAGRGPSGREIFKAADISVRFGDTVDAGGDFAPDCIIPEGGYLKLADLLSLTDGAYRAVRSGIAFAGLYRIGFGAMALFGRFDTFTAKTLNTMNSAIVLILNKRIEYFRPGNP